MQQLLGTGSAAAGTLPPTETCQDSGLEMLVAVTALPNEVCDRGDATGGDRVAWRSVWGAGAAPRKEGTWLRHSHKDRAQQEAAIPLSYPTPVRPSCPAGHQHRPGPPAPRVNTVADESSPSSFPLGRKFSVSQECPRLWELGALQSSRSCLAEPLGGNIPSSPIASSSSGSFQSSQPGSAGPREPPTPTFSLIFPQ